MMFNNEDIEKINFEIQKNLIEQNIIYEDIQIENSESYLHICEKSSKKYEYYMKRIEGSRLKIKKSQLELDSINKKIKNS